MQAQTHYIDAFDSHKIFLRSWHPNTKSKAVIHINHGMSEHSERYQYFAEKLTDAGFAVVAHDHRGHGHSIPAGGLVGHFADDNGWSKVVTDVKSVNDWIKQQHANLPIIVFGHSMGSFILQYFLTKYTNSASAAIFSGSTRNSIATIQPSKLILRLERYRLGPHGRSNIVDQLTFSQYNRQFKNAQTDADWLSRDKEQIKLYLDDPLCGFYCTIQLWTDFLKGLEYLNKPRNIQRIPKSLPIYIVSGERDPISYHTKHHGVDRLARHFEANGLKDITTKIYPDARHEILNETNRDEVITDILAWLESKLAKNQSYQAVG